MIFPFNMVPFEVTCLLSGGILFLSSGGVQQWNDDFRKPRQA